MKTSKTMSVRETLMLDALKEAFEIISSQNYGNCVASVVDQIEALDPQFLRKHGWQKGDK